MCPLVKEFRKRGNMEIRVCVSGQHREMLSQVLELFDIVPEYDLKIMQPGQSLFDITSKALFGIRDVLVEYRPDLVFVHGDTTTAYKYPPDHKPGWSNPGQAPAGLERYTCRLPVGNHKRTVRYWGLSAYFCGARV